MIETPDVSKYDHLIVQALAEDIGPGDITTEAVVSVKRLARGTFVAHEKGVVAGLFMLEWLFQKIDTSAEFKFFVADGDRVEADQVLASVKCRARALLSGERVALNFLQRLSGIASYARSCVDLVDGMNVKILDTRKTTPGWRHLEKYAARCGGAKNHRVGLYDMVLIKENHQEISKRSLREAISAARDGIPAGVQIEVEVHDLAHALDAVEGGADVVMLDNMNGEELSRGVEMVRGAEKKRGSKVIVEISGGINRENLLEYAKYDVDWISLGAITHSAPALDISLDIEASD